MLFCAIVPILGTWYGIHVRIMARSTLLCFVEKLKGHKDQRAVKAALDSWFQEVKRAEWKNSVDVKARYASDSIVGAERVVFNIKGNAYRLVVGVDYEHSIVFIEWLGTHKEYDAIDVRTIEHGTEAN